MSSVLPQTAGCVASKRLPLEIAVLMMAPASATTTSISNRLTNVSERSALVETSKPPNSSEKLCAGPM